MDYVDLWMSAYLCGYVCVRGFECVHVCACVCARVYVSVHTLVYIGKNVVHNYVLQLIHQNGIMIIARCFYISLHFKKLSRSN